MYKYVDVYDCAVVKWRAFCTTWGVQPKLAVSLPRKCKRRWVVSFHHLVRGRPPLRLAHIIRDIRGPSHCPVLLDPDTAHCIWDAYTVVTFSSHPILSRRTSACSCCLAQPSAVPGLTIRSLRPDEYTNMPFSIPSVRIAQASPSISLEKGTHRMRAPPLRIDTSSRSLSAEDTGPLGRAPAPVRARRRRSGMAATELVPASYEKRMTLLVVLLTCAMLASFGTAWYLWSTR